MGGNVSWTFMSICVCVIAATVADPPFEDFKLEVQLSGKCSSSNECAHGLHCSSCGLKLKESKYCVRSTATNPFRILNSSLPFNKYAFLTTHNSFANSRQPSYSGVPRITFSNQEDSITQQLHHGVRALMLDMYEFKGDIWLCHSFKGTCRDYTAYEPAINSLKEIEAFLLQNPTEIVTLIIEDHVDTPNLSSKLFKESGLMKFWFPVSNMPRGGHDWPSVNDMVHKNHRLIVFSSKEHKQHGEGIAYQWHYMVENRYGRSGMVRGRCSNRKQSSPLNDKTKSLILVNHFRTIPIKAEACADNSARLIDMLHTCYTAAGNRWANFVAVDYYKRSDGGGSFKAVDMLNGKRLCGHTDVHYCHKPHDLQQGQSLEENTRT